VTSPEPDSVRALREALAKWHEPTVTVTRNKINVVGVSLAAEALLDDLPGLLAEAWDEGVEYALQMVNPELINDTWDRHNPYRAAAAVCRSEWTGADE
jgi:hypothetical protein